MKHICDNLLIIASDLSFDSDVTEQTFELEMISMKRLALASTALVAALAFMPASADAQGFRGGGFRGGFGGFRGGYGGGFRGAGFGGYRGGYGRGFYGRRGIGLGLGGLGLGVGLGLAAGGLYGGYGGYDYGYAPVGYGGYGYGYAPVGYGYGYGYRRAYPGYYGYGY